MKKLKLYYFVVDNSVPAEGKPNQNLFEVAASHVLGSSWLCLRITTEFDSNHI